MSKLIKELTKEWKEYRDRCKESKIDKLIGFDRGKEVYVKVSTKPTMEGFMDYLTNKEL
jgi:hypothetical protein